jgi:membrane associated rhomboid family serine protease
MPVLRRIQYNSPVILTYTLLSLLVLLLAVLTKGASNNFFCAYRTAVTDPLLYLRLFTHALGHVHFDHYFGNFVLILLVGPMLEEKYGSKAILIMILVTAFITGGVYIFISNPNAALMGASGVVFMMILLSSFVNLQRGRVPLTLILVILAYIGKEVLQVNAADNISHLTHIIGGLCGAVLGFFMNIKKLEGKEEFSATNQKTITEESHA